MSILDLQTLTTPIVIFGGPYSNLQATNAIMQVCEDKVISSNHVICTGDIVAYCGAPEETINKIRQWGCHVVMGNCEESLGEESDNCGCGFKQGSMCDVLSNDWYNYAINQVSASNKQWMNQLPRQINFSCLRKNFSVIHGGVDNISEFIFQSSPDSRKRQIIDRLKADCVIGGHCGIPFGQSIENATWLNAGVIGMPANDGQQKSWYMIIEEENDQLVVHWHELEFDAQASIKDMDNARLADEYKNTLATGLWPSMSVLPEIEKQAQGKKLSLKAFKIT